jgi:hypothetical protein
MNKLHFCIATLTHDGVKRDTQLELTINTFLENTNIPFVKWFIFINGESEAIFNVCDNLRTKWKHKVDIIPIQSNINLGVGAGINRLNDYCRDYKYTLFLEGDWITLPKNIAGFDSEWLNRSLEMMETNNIEQIQLRKYQHDTDNRQFGFAYWIVDKNVESVTDEFVFLKERDYTNNPHIRKNSAYYNLGVFPLKEFYDESGNPTELKTSTQWGQAEIQAFELGRKLKSAWLKNGIMVHCDHWHYDDNFDKVVENISGCGYETNCAINCKYGFTFPREEFCKFCDSTKDFKDLTEHNSRFEASLR